MGPPVPGDTALKLLYLAIRNAGMRWRRGIEWTAAMGQFAIHFGDRFPGAAIFATPLMLGRRVHAQNENLRRVRGAPADADRWVSLHAPVVECIGKGQGAKALRIWRQGC